MTFESICEMGLRGITVISGHTVADRIESVTVRNALARRHGSGH